MKCQECGAAKRCELYADPRCPPLDTEPCLCGDCRRAYLEEVRDDIEERLSQINAELSSSNGDK